MLKDLYLEIEKLKEGLVTHLVLGSFIIIVKPGFEFLLWHGHVNADVRAAREKNGVYIPHDKFALDEAEKKVDF